MAQRVCSAFRRDVSLFTLKFYVDGTSHLFISVAASTFKNVICEVRGSKKNVGYIQMNHPKVNALSDAHIADIIGAMKAYDANPEVGCMILTGGTGKVFCGTFLSVHSVTLRAEIGNCKFLFAV